MKSLRFGIISAVAALAIGVVGGYATDAGSQPLAGQTRPDTVAAQALSGQQESRERLLRGDVNCDSVVDFGDINPFVLLLSDQAAWEAMYPDCPAVNGDINLDWAVDFGDINPFVALLAGVHLGEVFHTDCWEGREGSRGWCPPDVIELTVEGNILHTDHQNAEYNCCFEDIVISLTVEGDLIRLDEEEIAPEPCWCICCNEIWATVEGLSSGTYTVEYCWFEYDTNQVECYTGVIVIP